MTRLLHKPLRAFALYSLIILLISIPIYVLVVDHIWVTELDENNWLTLQHTKQKLKSRVYTQDDIEKINQIWGELQPGVSITKINEDAIRQDSVYEVIRPNEYDTDDGEDRFRGLISHLNINGQLYQLTIETNVEESDETLLAVTLVTLFFFLILIIGFILLNRRIAKKSWKPFFNTLHSLESFDLTKDHDLHLAQTDIQEFQKLNESLNNLVNSNLAIYQQQKSFIENASHELQTPIALLKSKLDILIQQKHISREISETLNGIEAPLSRLSRINKNLLLLAKVENHQYSEQEELDFKELTETALDLFEDYAKEKNLQLTNKIKESLFVKANSFLLETLIHNLLSNAIRHTSVNGQIEILVHDNTFQVKNSGMESLNKKGLFERFSTTSSDKVSSGLGLAIIKEIVKKYNWQVDYHFERGFHIFSVEFS